ncbi:MAG: aminomethyltransferase [Thiomonas sp. 15-66-11]|nr:MAG: aminomethyltransferase [Thiomonas sp. 15-66-11]
MSTQAATDGAAACAACDNGTLLGLNPTVDHPIAPHGIPEPGVTYVVPARQGRALRVRRGQVVRIINPHGTQVGDAWALNADDLGEYLSMPHTRAATDHLIPRVGDVLVSNRRRPMLRFSADTSPGVHDTQMAACDLYRYRGLGVVDYHDNCADNFRMALQAVGLRAQDVPAPLNLWMNIPFRPDGSVAWLAPVSKPGDHVEFMACMNLVVVLSACPQDIIVINARKPVELHVQVLAADIGAALSEEQARST